MATTLRASGALQVRRQGTATRQNEKAPPALACVAAPRTSCNALASLPRRSTLSLSCNPSGRPSRMTMSAGGSFGSDGAEHDEYLAVQVVDAVRMVPNRSQLFMTMANGEEVEVSHVNPTAGKLLYQAATPTIFLRMATDRDLMLPIVVGEAAVALLMKGFHREQGHLARPNHYELLGNLVNSLHYEIRMVKITQRIVDTYYARIYLAKPGEKEMISIDARPSDAINMAVRKQVPIFVNKTIVTNDAVRIVHERSAVDIGGGSVRSSGLVFNAILDRVPELLGSPSKDFENISDELALIKGMIKAAAEERYADAARYRDSLSKLRESNKPKLNKVDVWFKKFKEVGKHEMY